MLFGNRGQALLTLHERHSRLLLPHPLTSKAAQPVADAITQLLAPFPKRWRKSVTFDNGTEFARHFQLHDLGTQTFLCDPRSPWQKGGVENVNGRLRRFLPRQTNLSLLPENLTYQIVQAYNHTPRKCLGFLTPAEILAKSVLHLKCESTFPFSREYPCWMSRVWLDFGFRGPVCDLVSKVCRVGRWRGVGSGACA